MRYDYETRKAFSDLVFDALLTEHKAAGDSVRNATGVQHPQIVLWEHRVGRIGFGTYRIHMRVWFGGGISFWFDYPDPDVIDKIEDVIQEYAPKILERLHGRTT